MPIGTRIKMLREARGLTQMQLAVAANLSLTGLTKIEQGVSLDPKWSAIQRLADALDVTTERLRDTVDEQVPDDQKGGPKAGRAKKRK